MGVLFVLLSIILVLAIAAIAVWLWLFLDVLGQVTELMRIKLEEQVAVWRIEAVSRIAQLEQRHLGEQHRSRSSKDR